MKRLKWPCAAALLAGAGFALRRWQEHTAFEGELGLSVPNAPASWAMTGFFALALLLFLLPARTARVRRVEQDDLSRWDLTFAAQKDAPVMVLMLLAALVSLAAVLLLFQEASRMMAERAATGEGDGPLLQIALAVCCLPGAFGLAVTAMSAVQMKARGRDNALLLLPVLLSCVWLLEAYRSNAADPVLWDYVPLLLAVALGLVFRLECAGLAFSKKPRPRRVLWLAGAGAAVSGAALGSMDSPAMALLLAGQLLEMLACLWVAPGNLERPPESTRFARRMPPRSGEDETGGGDDPGHTETIQEDDTNG